FFHVAFGRKEFPVTPYFLILSRASFLRFYWPHVIEVTDVHRQMLLVFAIPPHGVRDIICIVLSGDSEAAKGPANCGCNVMAHFSNLALRISLSENQNGIV